MALEECGPGIRLNCCFSFRVRAHTQVVSKKYPEGLQERFHLGEPNPRFTRSFQNVSKSTAVAALQKQHRPVVEHKGNVGPARDGMRSLVRGLNELVWQTKSRARPTFVRQSSQRCLW